MLVYFISPHFFSGLLLLFLLNKTFYKQLAVCFICLQQVEFFLCYFLVSKQYQHFFLSSLIAWNFFWPYELYEFRNLGLLISYLAIIVAWGVFKYLDAEISFDSKLKLSNWRHLVLFILLCSLLNGLFDGAFYSTDVNIINPLISLRFFVGDVTGTIFVLVFCMLIISAFDIKRN